MKEFFMIRHGETDWNAQHLRQGLIDNPLNEAGRDQARLARHFVAQAQITHIVSSTLSRAFDTAQILNEDAQLPLTTDARLVERCFGIYEGRPLKEAPSVNGHVADGQPHEKIEAAAAVVLRTRRAIEDAQKLYPQGRILFVTHGGVMSLAQQEFQGSRTACRNAVPYHFQPAQGRWNIAEFLALKPAA